MQFGGLVPCVYLESDQIVHARFGRIVTSMTRLLTPKQVARAIGVSESSLKRWCDKGLIPMSCTAGGHRRLPISGVLEFIRTNRHGLVDAAAIGLPPNTGNRRLSLAESWAVVRDALVAGDEMLVRQVVLDLFLDGNRISSICDQVLTRSFHEIGAMWDCGQVEVYQERRACRLCTGVLHELRQLLSPAQSSGPIALGGTPEGDFYDVPTTMVELVMQQEGWQATSLGSSLPFATMSVAIVENRPTLFWLSVSHIADEERFVSEYIPFFETAMAYKTMVVVGGRALSEEIRKRIKYSVFCDNLTHLETYLVTSASHLLAGADSAEIN